MNKIGSHVFSSRIERKIEQGRSAAKDIISTQHNSPVSDPADVTSTFEDSDSDFELDDRAKIPFPRTSSKPSASRNASVAQDVATDDNGPVITPAARKARRKALMRMLGLSGTTPARKADDELHERRRSLGSMRLSGRIGTAEPSHPSSDDDEEGFSSA